jgi:hypothetical protein
MPDFMPTSPRGPPSGGWRCRAAMGPLTMTKVRPQMKKKPSEKMKKKPPEGKFGRVVKTLQPLRDGDAGELRVRS